MEKVILEVPDWVDPKTDITVLIGRETYLVRLGLDGKWYKKIIRCNLCGICCQMEEGKWPPGTKLINGVSYCRFVREGPPGQFWCQGGQESPAICAFSSPTDVMPKECVLKYEDVTNQIKA